MTYRQLLNSALWRDVRAEQIRRQPLCEQCKSAGRVVAAECVHHIVPVETAKTDADMVRLCFSYGNLQSLCRECHHALHHAERYNSRAAHRQREAERLARWKERRQLGMRNEELGIMSAQPTPPPPSQRGGGGKGAGGGLGIKPQKQ